MTPIHPEAILEGPAKESSPSERPGVTRILHLEDSPSDAALIQMEIGGTDPPLPAAIRLTDSQREFEAAVKEGDIDLILCDYSLPGYDGEEAIKTARALQPEIPVIVVTGELGEERAVETLKMGATDYVLKDNLRRLVPSIRRALR